ncbi:SusC/RagA family TonB-linked outer membrane protein [Flavivirga rizhaonensis]|nr:SusC/RagA family TonB-linked outer membrane protein [Flavivirga rizhaonensis]
MRTFILLFCTAAFSLSSGELFSQDVKIDIDSDKTITIDEVFQIIKTQTDYRFVYRSDAFKNAPKIYLKKGLINAHDLLVKSLAFGNLYYELTPNRTIVLKERNQSPIQEPITGVVKDERGLPLSGVSIIVDGTTKGTLTDFDGGYSIVVSKGQLLSFSYLGKKVQIIKIGDSNIINVILEDSVESLEETIVVAYGTSKKKSLVGSVSTINAKEIEERPITNFAQSLEGTVAGLQTVTAEGRPGASPQIIIRGIGTARLGSSFEPISRPLFVIDGFPFDVTNDTSGTFNSFDPLSTIDPSDIESISVLKDASATALYGARAANGVVLITTKKGKGKVRFNFRSQLGVVTPATSLAKTLDKPQYYEVMWQGLKNQFSASNDSQTAAALATDNLISQLGYNVYNVPDNELVNNQGVFNPNAQLLFNDFDWWDATTGLALRTNYGMDVSAGNDKSDYFASFSYTKDEGYVLNSKLERFNARINTNSQATNWLKLSANLNASHNIGVGDRVTNTAFGGNPISFPRLIGPIYPVFMHNADGSFVLDELGNRVYDIGQDRLGATGNVLYANAFGDRPYQVGSHPIESSVVNDNLNTTTILSGRSNVDITFLKGLRFRTGLGVDLNNNNVRSFFFDPDPRERDASRRNFTQRAITFNQLLSYNKQFGKHTFDILLGHESVNNQNERFSAASSNQIFDGNIELNNFNPSAIDDESRVTSSFIETSLESYFSRLNYEFDAKYFASLSYRRDGTSILEEDARWGDFYSVGLGWILSNESFLNDADWINFLKLRASHGTSGNVAGFGAYESQATYSRNDNGNLLGYVPGNPGGRELVWEGQQLTDIGVEFTLFGNKVSGTIEYYNKTSKDLIFQVPQAPSLGIRFNELNVNIGEIVNEGLEIQLQSDIIKTDDFTWNVNINASTASTKVTELSRDEPVNLGFRLLTEGHDLFEWYGRDFVGVNPANGDPLYRGLRSPNDYDPARDIIVANDTLTSNASNAQNYRTGKTATPDIFGGITNTFTYKRFSLTALLTYQIGGYMNNVSYLELLHPRLGQTAHVDILNAWKQPGDITDVPRVDFNTNHLNNVTAFSNRNLVSRTSLNIRRITLNYQFPKRILSNIAMNNLNMYVTGENLAFFSAQKGLNAGAGLGQSVTDYSPGRIISLGLNIGF